MGRILKMGQSAPGEQTEYDKMLEKFPMPKLEDYATVALYKAAKAEVGRQREMEAYRYFLALQQG